MPGADQSFECSVLTQPKSQPGRLKVQSPASSVAVNNRTQRSKTKQYQGRGEASHEDRFKMALQKVNWQSFLSPESDLPPDVFFLVKPEDENAEGSGKSIGAHRLLLAGVSPVFKSMLFGPMKEVGEVIEVKETTHEAFNTMITYIYAPPLHDFTLDDIQCPQKLFELLALSDKYEILELKTMTSEALSSLEITNGTMIFAATVAKRYKHMFEEVCKKLLTKCLKFLFDTTSGGNDVFTLLSETKKNFPDASFDVLEELINVGNETFEALQLPGM